MVVKKLVVFVGDESIRGGNASSVLISSNPSYLGPRSDLQVWNNVGAAWQAYNCGINSANLGETPADLFGPELSFREALPASLVAPGEVVYLFKAAFTDAVLTEVSTARNKDGSPNGAGQEYPCLQESVRDTAYTAMYSQLVAALAAAKVGGHTVLPILLVVGIGFAESLFPSNSDAFPSALSTFVANMKRDIEAANLAGYSVYENLRTALCRPHNKFLSGSFVVRNSYEKVRVSYQKVESILPNCIVVSSDHLAVTAPSGKTLTAGSVIAQGLQVGASAVAVAPAAITEPSSPKDVFILAGDSLAEGYNTPPTLPPYLMSPSGVNIWSILNHAWEPLTLANNLTTQLALGVPQVGAEFGLGEAARQTVSPREVYILKGALVGSSVSPSNFPLPNVWPFFDGQVNDWCPEHSGELFDRVVNGWFSEGITALQQAYSGSARVRRALIFLGTNDGLSQDGGARARACGPHALLLCRALEDWARAKGALNTGESLKITFVLPFSELANLVNVLVVENHINEARASLISALSGIPNITLLEPSAISAATVSDGVHYSTESHLAFGRAAGSASGGQQYALTPVTQTEPLFVPSRAMLTASIRLKNVPANQNAQDVINAAIQSVRVNLFSMMGAEKISTINLVPFLPNPSTDAEYRRALAVSVETKWVRLELMRTLPMMFVDGSAADQVWQNEAAFRAATLASIKKEADAIAAEIQNALAVLIDDLPLAGLFSGRGGMSIQAVGPSGFSIYPGETVQGGVL